MHSGILARAFLVLGLTAGSAAHAAEPAAPAMQPADKMMMQPSDKAMSKDEKPTKDGKIEPADKAMPPAGAMTMPDGKTTK